MFHRDVLVLNPEWQTISNGNGLFFAGPSRLASSSLLPVVGNHHIKDPLKIRYRIFGSGSGELLYTLWTKEGTEVCHFESAVTLPMDFRVEQEGEDFQICGQPVLGNLPAGTNWLIGSFQFRTADGHVSERKIAHRLQEKPSDAGYSNGVCDANSELSAAPAPATVFERLAKIQPLHGRFLDVGCGTGMLVEEAVDRGLDAEGIDISKRAVEKANERCPGRCRVMNFDTARNNDFPAHYDIVMVHSVIEHVGYPKAVLQLIHEICAPQALVLIQTLNADSIMHRVRKENWSGYSDPTHQSPWITADWLRETAINLGFEIVSERTYGIWNDETEDEATQAFTHLLKSAPMNVLLEQGLGDFVEIILRKVR